MPNIKEKQTVLNNIHHTHRTRHIHDMDEEAKLFFSRALISMVCVTYREDDIIRVAADANLPLELFLRLVFAAGMMALLVDVIKMEGRHTPWIDFTRFDVIVMYMAALIMLKLPKEVLTEPHYLITRTFRAVSLLASLMTAVTVAAIYLRDFGTLMTEPLFHALFAAALLMLSLNIATILYAVADTAAEGRIDKRKDAKNKKTD